MDHYSVKGDDMRRSRQVVLAMMVGDGKGKRFAGTGENMGKKGEGRGRDDLNSLNGSAHGLMGDESLGEDTGDTENGV